MKKLNNLHETRKESQEETKDGGGHQEILKITDDEIMVALKTLKSDRGAGSDGIISEVLRRN